LAGGIILPLDCGLPTFSKESFMGRFMLVCLLFLAPAVFAAEVKATAEVKTSATFEGEMTRNIMTPESSATAQYLIKGNKARINIETKNEKQSMLVDKAAHQVTKFMAEKKTYVTVEIPDVPKSAGAKGAALKRTGKTQVLLGKTCEEWVYKSPQEKVTLWAVSGLGEYMGMTSAIRQPEAWMDAVRAKNLYPMKVVNQDASGKTVYSMEVTKMEEKALPDDPFNIPKDFQKMDLTTLLLQGQEAEKK
jgi:hypothetical protein